MQLPTYLFSLPSIIRTVIFIIFLFLLLLVPNSSFAHSQTQVIEMTSEGFIPSEVTIDQNQSVIFINKDKKAHWPASNPHPTHDLYPEFDPQLPIESGKSWAFKPKKVGEWKYHDHLNPHIGGTLKVIGEATNQPVGWIENLKKTIQNFFTKFKKVFEPKIVLDSSKFISIPAKEQIIQLEKYANSSSAEKVWQFIKDTYKDQAGSSGNIHDLAHLAGGLLFEKLDFNGITKCSPEFAFGCFHGFLDKAFAKNLDHLADAHDACLKLSPDLSGPAASCIHGIGHGVASFYQLRDLQKSLTSCRMLISGQQYCFDGVLMEYVRSAPIDFYKKDNPLYPCDDLENRFGYAYSESCGRNQPTMLMSRFNFGFDDIVKICLNSESKPFKQACFDSLGFSLASSADSEQITKGCQKIGVEEYINRCSKAAAGELVFQQVPGWMEKSKAVCSQLENNQECSEHVKRLIKEYHRS